MGPSALTGLEAMSQPIAFVKLVAASELAAGGQLNANWRPAHTVVAEAPVALGLPLRVWEPLGFLGCPFGHLHLHHSLGLMDIDQYLHKYHLHLYRYNLSLIHI